MYWIINPDWMESLLKKLYNNGNFDEGQFDTCMNKLFHYLIILQKSSKLLFDSLTHEEQRNVQERAEFDKHRMKYFYCDDKYKKKIRGGKKIILCGKEFKSITIVQEISQNVDSLLIHVFYTDDKGAQGGHTVAVRVVEGKCDIVRFFDPNFGICEVPRNELDKIILDHFTNTCKVTVTYIQVMVVGIKNDSKTDFCYI
jgi:hypothetical protein